MTGRALAAAWLLLTGGAAMAAPSPTERRMIAAVTAEAPRSLALLERLVGQNSGSLNTAGVTRVAEMVRPEFEALGFAVTWKPLPETGRAGHLIAVHRGRPGAKRLLLIGHLDTVFEPSSPFQRFRRDGSRATGPGVGDDKGGIVVMLAALRAMQAAGTLTGANIEVVLTGDEESIGTPREAARADLVAAGARADIALDFEGLARDGGRDMGSIARRSSNSFELTVKAKSGHSSRVNTPQAGDGAIYELARILDAFRREVADPSVSLNIGLVAGGTDIADRQEGTRTSVAGKGNIIPGVAIARGGFRTLSREISADVRAKMTAIVARNLPGSSASIRFSEGYPPMPPTPASRALLGELNRVNADLGLSAMAELDPLDRGAGDIAFVGQLPGLIGLGTAGEGAHAEGEWIDIDSIATQAKRAAILMSRLGR